MKIRFFPKFDSSVKIDFCLNVFWIRPSWIVFKPQNISNSHILTPYLLLSLIVTKICISFDKTLTFFFMLSALLSHLHWMVEFASNKVISYNVLCGKQVLKKEIIVFGYNQGSKLKIRVPFENFGYQLHRSSTLMFHVNSLWKDLQWKAYFLSRFTQKSWKTTKCIFWLQKIFKMKIWWHFQICDPKLVYISFLLFLDDGRFIPLVGGYKSRNFGKD